MKARERISLHRLILHTGVKPELVKGVFNFFIVFLHFPREVFFFANLRLCVSVQNRWHSWPCPARTAAVTLVGWDPAPTSRRKTRHLGLGWAEQALSQSWTEAFQDLPRPPPTHPPTPSPVSGPAAVLQIVASQAEQPVVPHTGSGKRVTPVSRIFTRPPLWPHNVAPSTPAKPTKSLWWNCKFERHESSWQVTHQRTLIRPNSSRLNYLFVSGGILAFFSCSNLAGQVTKHLAAQLSGAMWPGEGGTRSRSSQSRGTASAAHRRDQRGASWERPRNLPSQQFLRIRLFESDLIFCHSWALWKVVAETRAWMEWAGEEDHVRAQPVQLQLWLLSSKAKGCSICEALPVMASP